MADKVVLVQYLDRNKIPRLKEETDIEFLQFEFCISFNLSKNVSIVISFQWYDPEWEEYVEIENYEDVKDKEMLKVVVAQCLHTSTESMVDSETLLVELRVLHEIN